MKLKAEVVKVVTLAPSASPFGLSYSNNALYIADYNNGIQSLNLCDMSETITTLVPSGEGCSQAHSVCVFEGMIYFTDTAKRQVLQVSQDQNVSVVAGTGNSGIQDGLWNECEFVQPTGLCFEGKTLYMCDAASGHIIMIIVITSLKGVLKYCTI